MKATLLPDLVPSFLAAARKAGFSCTVVGPDEARPWLDRVEGVLDPTLKVKPFRHLADVRMRRHVCGLYRCGFGRSGTPCPKVDFIKLSQHPDLPNLGAVEQASKAARLAEDNWRRGEAQQGAGAKE